MLEDCGNFNQTFQTLPNGSNALPNRSNLNEATYEVQANEKVDHFEFQTLLLNA